MRATKLLLSGILALNGVCLLGQQKAFDWIAQNPTSFRLGPGYHDGVAVYEPRGSEAIHVRLDIDARQPVTVGVVRLEDWDKAIRKPGLLSRLDYACLTEGVTHISYSCNFYPSNIARVVVVRDSRLTERPVVTGVAAPFLRSSVNETYANDVHVKRYEWECVSHCELPDPPQLAWVENTQKFEISSTPKSYGPFTPANDADKLRIRVRAQLPVTVAVLPNALADELYAHRDRAREILAQSKCKEYGIQSSTLECTFQKSDGAMQVVLLTDIQTRKKKAEVTISTVQCVANCTQE